MSWSSPATAVAGSVLTAAWLNTYLRDNITFVHDVIIPIGGFVGYGGAAAPASFYLCDGTAKNRVTDAALYAVLGTAYGVGDGSTTFNLPDFRGRTVVGAGTGSGLTARSLGQTFGEETHVLTLAEIPGFTGWDTTTGDQNVHGGSAGQPSGVGGGGAHNNMQPSGVATWIVRYV